MTSTPTPADADNHPHGHAAPPQSDAAAAGTIRSTRRTCRAAAVLSGALTLAAVTGCGISHRSGSQDAHHSAAPPRAGAYSPTPVVPPASAVGSSPTSPDAPDGAGAAPDRSVPAAPVQPNGGDRSADGARGAPLTASSLAALLTLPDPDGTVPQIALRFMTALQSRQWADAAAQLSLDSRLSLSQVQPGDAQASLADVLQHTGGDRLGRCTTSQPVGEDAAAVACGPVTVLVQVDPSVLPGVLTTPDHPIGDLLDRPHTHAYTTRVQ